jgi:hypothetical protein
MILARSSRRRTRHLATVCVIVLVAVAVASAALASTTTRDARGLALREQDFPSSVKRMSQKENRSAALPGGTGQAYTTTFQFRVGRRLQSVGTIVITAPSAAVARSAYAAATASSKGGAVAALRLPPLGDQQYAALYGRPAVNETSAVVWVRRNTVVWQIQTSSVRNPFGFSQREALAELTTYALKQKRRVGGG